MIWMVTAKLSPSRETIPLKRPSLHCKRDDKGISIFVLLRKKKLMEELESEKTKKSSYHQFIFSHFYATTPFLSLLKLFYFIFCHLLCHFTPFFAIFEVTLLHFLPFLMPLYSIFATFDATLLHFQPLSMPFLKTQVLYVRSRYIILIVLSITLENHLMSLSSTNKIFKNVLSGLLL